MENAQVKLKCWNYHTFDLEADKKNMPDILWLSQFFASLEPELIPIFECFIEVAYAEIYSPEPLIGDFLKNPDKYNVKRISFSGVSNYFWVYHFGKIIEAYELAKKEFKKRKPPTDEGDRKAYQVVKKFFDEH